MRSELPTLLLSIVGMVPLMILAAVLTLVFGLDGTISRTDGGWRLNGRWQFGSGVDHGPWLLLGAAGEKDADGQRLPPRHVVVPTSDIIVC